MKKNYVFVLLLGLSAASLQAITIGVFKSFLASFIVYSLLLCIGSFIVYCKKQYSRISSIIITESLGLNITNNRLWLVGILSGFIIVIIMILGFIVFYRYFSNAKVVIDAAASMGIQKNFSLIIAIVGLVINAAAEEVFWRGTLHNLLGLNPENQNKEQSKEKKLLSRTVLIRILVISFLFGLNHVGIMAGIAPSVSAGLLSLLGITLSGILWGVMREITYSIIPSLISHILVTLGYSGLLVYYFML